MNRSHAVGLLALATAVAALLLPVLVAVRIGADDAGRVFAATWVVGLVPSAAGTAVVWWTLRRPSDPSSTAAERGLTVVVPVVVVLLVGAPWILSVFGLHVRDTGVGSLILVALAAVPYTVVATSARSAAVSGRVAGALAGPVVAVVLAVAVAWVTAPVVGVIGAAFGWLLGWSAVAVVRFRRVLPIASEAPLDVEARSAPR